jgi:hypothetical protein
MPDWAWETVKYRFFDMGEGVNGGGGVFFRVVSTFVNTLRWWACLI